MRRFIAIVILLAGCTSTGLGTAPPSDVLAARDDGWPWVDGVHPAVVDIPREHERSIESVARWIADAEPDPTLRIKAIHDYVATHITYDIAARDATFDFPDQSAEAVFAKRLGVCEGFAKLAVALGTAADLDIVEVDGDVRVSNADAIELHAWNAARIGDRWVLFDATWDAGRGDETFHRSYSTEYLMTPPAIFAATHFADEERWRLLVRPMSRAQWLNDLAMPPAFFARGLAVRGATRHGTETARIVLDNPLDLDISAAIATAGTTSQQACAHEDSSEDAFVCPLRGRGHYLVDLWNETVWLGELAVHVPTE